MDSIASAKSTGNPASASAIVSYEINKHSSESSNKGTTTVVPTPTVPSTAAVLDKLSNYDYVIAAIPMHQNNSSSTIVRTNNGSNPCDKKEASDPLAAQIDDDGDDSADADVVICSLDDNAIHLISSDAMNDENKQMPKGNRESLPQTFEQLTLSTTDNLPKISTSTLAQHFHTTEQPQLNQSDTDSESRKNSKDLEGISPTVNYTNNPNSSRKSPIQWAPQPIVTLTNIAFPDNTNSTSQSASHQTNMKMALISKCLSQSSSTTTITSSSSPTSSLLLIESPSSLSPTVPLSTPCCNITPPQSSISPFISIGGHPPPELPAPSNVVFNPQMSIQTRSLPAKTQSLDFGSDDDDHSHHLHHLRHHYHHYPHHFHHYYPNAHCIIDDHGLVEHDDAIDADIEEEDESDVKKRPPSISVEPISVYPSLRQNLLQRNSVCSNSSSGSAEGTESSRLHDAQTDFVNQPVDSLDPNSKDKTPKTQSTDAPTSDVRPIYPNVPYSPYASPYGSPRSNRRRAPLRESRRISIERSGSFLQLNQYKLMDQIGQGSYGLVKLAYSEEDSTHYAMKILSKRRLLRKAGLMLRGPKKTTSPLDRVYREIAVLKKLDHPNVVKLIEVLDDPLEDSLYLVFELVQMGEVLSIPTENPLTEERAWSVFRDAVQGLEYLHYQRIIHADIKPGNLLLGECGRVKIADLGVCNEFLGEDASLNNGVTAGTPAFRAPETLIQGQHLYSGKAADIWALGATLYSLVYGNVPFVAGSVPAVYEKIKNEPLNFPDSPRISPDLRDLLEKILTKDPAQRITLPQIKDHHWVTSNGLYPLPSEDENCRLVQISDEDINSVVKSIPKLDTLILIKTMLKNHSFLNPFSKGVSGRAPQRGGSRLERFTRAGRSNSAPGAYHLPPDRTLSSDCILPVVSETSNNESSDGS